jgi:hypothetical protein
MSMGRANFTSFNLGNSTVSHKKRQNNKEMSKKNQKLNVSHYLNSALTKLKQDQIEN